VRDFEGHLKIYKELFCGEKYSGNSKKELEPEDAAEICLYLGFFEKIGFLLNKEVITLESVAELFTFRLLLATNNKKVQEKILYDKKLGSRFCSVAELHNKIVNYWKEKGVQLDGEMLDEKQCPCNC